MKSIGAPVFRRIKNYCIGFCSLLHIPFALCGQQLDYSLPLATLKVTSSYGYRIHPVQGGVTFHSGVDFAAGTDPVFSVLQGVVSQTGKHDALGRYIRIAHGPLETVYAHLSRILVRKGDSVFSGQLIGITGVSGRVTGAHLHFSVILEGRAINPLHFINRLQEQSMKPLKHE